MFRKCIRLNLYKPCCSYYRDSKRIILIATNSTVMKTVSEKSSLRPMSTDGKPRAKIDFFYDILSPYSWLAFESLHRYKERWNIDLDLQPVLLGAVFKATGNITISPVKVKYSHIDIVRSARYFEVDLILIKEIRASLSKGSLAPMRCLTACKLLYPEYLESLSRAFWMKRWHHDQDFTTDEAITDVIRSALQNSSSVEKLVTDITSKMKSQEVKDMLKTNSQRAVEIGIFGVPTMVTYGKDGRRELFFGSDRLPMLAHEIGEEWLGPNPSKSKANL